MVPGAAPFGSVEPTIFLTVAIASTPSRTNAITGPSVIMFSSPG